MRFNRGKRYSYYSSYTNSRKSRIRWDRIALIAGAVIIVLGVVIWFNLSRLQLMFKGYSFGQQNDILSLSSKAVDEVLSHDKMENITSWIDESKNYQYYDEYEKYLSLHKDTKVKTVVKVIDDIYDNYVPRLTTLKYTEKQIWEILKTATVQDVQHIVEKEYTFDDIEPFMKVKGFIFADLDDYMKVYTEKKNYNYAVLITTYPFIVSSNDVNKSYTIQNTNDVSILVKKGFYLPENYVPKDLVTPKMPIEASCKDPQLRKEASDALIEMYNAAKKEGYHLVINSAYRSFKAQKETYDDYFKKYDPVTAASLVSLPGASEHQTGLSVDLTCQAVIDDKRNGIQNSKFGYKPDYKWCVANSYKYGYILRFEEEKANITGIGNEPWHFRYVGKEAAKEIFNNGWTLEEYCLYKGIIPTVKEKK
ncbi:MAG: M15 family metallopeptidase [Coprobacillus sp.]|nr:M15 family metallopeptidase [Coprobacillus sp.]